MEIGILILSVTALLGWNYTIARQTVSLQKYNLLEKKVDAMMKHIGMTYDPFHDVPEAIHEHIRKGNTIEAIKLYRQHSGAGLREAKEAVEEMMSRR